MSQVSSHISHDPFLLNNAASRGRGLDHTLRGRELERPSGRSKEGGSSLRATAWRVIGALAIASALFGLGVMARHTDAFHAIIDWITFGVSTPDRSVNQDVQKGTGEISKP